MALPVMSELVFEVTRESTGGYDAESDTENLSAQGNTWNAIFRTARSRSPSACITCAKKPLHCRSRQTGHPQYESASDRWG